jgi:hypothetical protein
MSNEQRYQIAKGKFDRLYTKHEDAWRTMVRNAYGAVR